MADIRIIKIGDKDYPKLLKKIPQAPKILYCRGELKKEEPCFSVVGTRLCSPYGKQVVQDIAGSLANSGLTIVSGLATGIDALAHKSATDRNKRTIAVLGTGVDQASIYPKENIQLSKKILETGGCIISEYPPGTRPSRYNFPERNRIISGLSLGTLVVEAKEKSGSLITANLAILHKRKLFAVPGPIYSLNSAGTNLLIKKGAKLVDKYTDIMEELGLSAKYLKKENLAESQNPEEKKILEALLEEPLYIDKIIEKTKLNAKTTASLLTEMELEGKVKNLGANIFAISR